MGGYWIPWLSLPPEINPFGRGLLIKMLLAGEPEREYRIRGILFRQSGNNHGTPNSF